MTDSNKKGDRSERKLVNYLDKCGWAVMRAPASGSATERELPDVLAGNSVSFHAIEVKASSGDPIYIDGEEVDDLLYFAQNFGARACIAASFDTEYDDPAYGEDRPGIYLLDLNDLHVTDGGNYRIKKENAIEKGTPVSEL